MTDTSMEQLTAATQKALTAFDALKTDFTDLRGKMKSVEGFDQAKFNAMADDIARGIDLAQKAEAKAKAAADDQAARDAQFKAMEEKQGLLEAALSRPIAVATEEKKDADKELRAKGKELFNAFARKAGPNARDFVDFLKSGGEPADLALKAMSVNSDPDGGYLVMPELGGTIETFVRETSPMRQLASVQTISTDSLEYILDNDEAGAGWVGETQARPETSTPTLGKLTIPVNEIYAQPKATQKLIDDAAVDIEAWLARKVAEKFARMENTAFIAGDGLNKPRGILTYAAGTTPGSQQVEQIVTGSGSAITYDGLVNLQTALKEEYQANAAFLVNRLGFGSLLLIKDGNSTPIFNMQYDLRVGLQRSILGAPLYFATDIPAVATNALAAAYGDFKRAYQIVDRTGIRVLRDPFTDKPFVKFYTTKRVGGAVTNFEAVKLMKVST